jgi:hypothetical protein
MNDRVERPDPVRSFILDLLYPSMWGAMIALLFIRLADLRLAAITEPKTLFGIFLASFYGIGFVNAKMIAHYNRALAALDAISSALIFICFYVLGFSHDQLSSGDNYVLFYIFLTAVMVSPIFRRTFRGERAFWSRRTLMALSSSVVVLLALLNAIGLECLSWLTPTRVLVLLSFIFAVYLLDLWKRGVVA